MNNGDGEYTVGYGKPPVHYQFKKGQSGNPKGRRRVCKNSMEDDLNEVLSTRMKIIENGKRRYVTARQALIRKYLNDALKGDYRAFKVLFDAEARHSRIKKIYQDDQDFRDYQALHNMSDEELNSLINDYK